MLEALQGFKTAGEILDPEAEALRDEIIKATPERVKYLFPTEADGLTAQRYIPLHILRKFMEGEARKTAFISPEAAGEELRLAKAQRELANAKPTAKKAPAPAKGLFGRMLSAVGIGKEQPTAPAPSQAFVKYKLSEVEGLLKDIREIKRKSVAASDRD